MGTGDSRQDMTSRDYEARWLRGIRDIAADAAATDAQAGRRIRMLLYPPHLPHGGGTAEGCPGCFPPGEAIRREIPRGPVPGTSPATAREGYDPVPDLAALIDGVHDLATASAVDGLGILGSMLTGPYTRLRGGLLLDEPGRENMTEEDALREALRELG